MKVKITIEYAGETHTYEGTLVAANEWLEAFTRMMVTCGFPPYVIRDKEGGRWECEYKEEDGC